MSKQFEGLKALFINCSIKKDKTKSHTQALIDKAVNVMEAEGVEVEQIYALDYTIAFGMIKDGAQDELQDDWPKIQKKIMESDILVIGTPIWR
jgi:multimeric flavodoxin WrbA